MKDKIRVSCVSYLNSAPFRYGLENHPVKEDISIFYDNPAECAARLRKGEVEIGLVPVAAIYSIPQARIISGWCIGAVGEVKSVTLLSRVPLEQISTILLDYQSRTSVQLTRVLASKYWKINPTWEQANAGFENLINGTIAGVVIGDRSLELQKNFEFVYDLSGEWQKFTDLPFVFACWVSNRDLPVEFLKSFEDALSQGIREMDKVVSELEDNQQQKQQMIDYLRNNISYKLDEEKKKGMSLFLEYLSQLSPDPVREQG